MQVKFEVNGEEFKLRLDRDGAAFVEANDLAVGDATTRIKERARARIRVAFPTSRKLPTVVRGESYPTKSGKAAAGYVWSLWASKRGGGDILLAFVRGSTIRPKQGRLLVVPLLERHRRSEVFNKLADLGRDPRVALIKSLGGRMILVERAIAGTRQRRSRLLAVLVPSVKMPKRLSVDDLEHAAADALEQRAEARLQEKGF